MHERPTATHRAPTRRRTGTCSRGRRCSRGSAGGRPPSRRRTGRRGAGLRMWKRGCTMGGRSREEREGGEARKTTLLPAQDWANHKQTHPAQGRRRGRRPPGPPRAAPVGHTPPAEAPPHAPGGTTPCAAPAGCAAPRWRGPRRAGQMTRLRRRRGARRPPGNRGTIRRRRRGTWSGWGRGGRRGGHRNRRHRGGSSCWRSRWTRRRGTPTGRQGPHSRDTGLHRQSAQVTA
jgi:hypothetical protein